LLDKSKLLTPSCAQVIKSLCLQLQKCNFATDLPRANATVSHEQLVRAIQQASGSAALLSDLVGAAAAFPFGHSLSVYVRQVSSALCGLSDARIRSLLCHASETGNGRPNAISFEVRQASYAPGGSVQVCV
jgi:hypothetical protein